MAGSSAASRRARRSADARRWRADRRDRRAAPQAAARARALGLRLAVENHGDLRAAELLELVERADDEALGVCLDTANALRVGDDPLEAAALLAPRTLMVHLKDVEPLAPGMDPVAGPRSVPYGEGAIPVAAVLATLATSGFDGLVCVELGQLGADADELAMVADGVAWLRRLRVLERVERPRAARRTGGDGRSPVVGPPVSATTLRVVTGSKPALKLTCDFAWITAAVRRVGAEREVERRVDHPDAQRVHDDRSPPVADEQRRRARCPRGSRRSTGCV